MDCLDVKARRIGKDATNKEIKYIYFGWNYITFHDDESEWIKEFVRNLKDYHLVSIGEEWDDIVESYHLNKTDVDCIQIIRGFDDGVRK
jgi:hypothetical protein